MFNQSNELMAVQPGGTSPFHAESAPTSGAHLDSKPSALTCQPKALLEEHGPILRKICRAADNIRPRRGQAEFSDWPEYCYLPTDYWHKTLPPGTPIPDPELSRFLQLMWALAEWRATQGIYYPDATLFAALRETSLSPDLPSDVLCRLPEWCIYVKTPGLSVGTTAVDGAFARMDWDINLRCPLLHIHLFLPPDLTQQVIVVLGNGPLETAVAKQFSDIPEFWEQGGQSAARAYYGPNYLADLHLACSAVLSLLLYICSENAELGTGQSRPRNPTAKRTKNGLRTFPAERVTTWPVGVRLGAALRRAYERNDRKAANEDKGTHASPRAHIRRAHWHHFWKWIGQERCLILKWLPPIPVNVDEPDLLPATIRPVQPANDSGPRAA